MGGLATFYERINEKNDELLYMKDGTPPSFQAEERIYQKKKEAYYRAIHSQSNQQSNTEAVSREYAGYLLKLKNSLVLRIKYLEPLNSMQSIPVRHAIDVIIFRMKQIYEETRGIWVQSHFDRLLGLSESPGIEDYVLAKKTVIQHILDRAISGINLAGSISESEMREIREDFDALISWFVNDEFLYGIPVPTGLDNRQISDFFSRVFHAESAKCTRCGAITSTVCCHCMSCGSVYAAARS